MASSRFLLVRFAFLAPPLALLAACSGRSVAPSSGIGRELAAVSDELPWEILSERGTSILPDVFYADASQNEQVIPTTVHGRHMIDRMVYPTIGNPALAFKDAGSEPVYVILRIEPEILKTLKPVRERKIARRDFEEIRFQAADSRNGLFFFLGNKQQRTGITSSDAYQGAVEVFPSQIAIRPQTDDCPPELRRRETVRVAFSPEALKGVTAGLYDLRFELRKDGEIVRLSGGPVYEYQYNAIRVFDKNPGDRYTILNFSDSQTSTGRMYSARTVDKLAELMAFLRESNDPAIRDAAFITFTGDLHNGGAPGMFLPSSVSQEYSREAERAIDLLSTLDIPVFLSVGNHDGYVATGHMPKELPASALEKVINAVRPEWEGFTLEKYRAFLKATENAPGGYHRNLFGGRFIRWPGSAWSSWKRLENSERNMVLYDGYNQWRRTYGPLYFSWSFGRNLYMSLNTFELRQHARAGWGMYTVNYGGGLSQVQMGWLERELEKSKERGLDVTLLAHHDPRGGHHGKDFPYYFRQVDYTGAELSFANYVQGKICGKLPKWAESEERELECTHDGLQEWMRADEEFDCHADEMTSEVCDKMKMQRHHHWYSGYQLLRDLSQYDHVRTLLLGHTHYNSYEMLQSGDALVPSELRLDVNSLRHLASLEVQNPIRASALKKRKLPAASSYDPEILQAEGVVSKQDGLELNLALAGHAIQPLRGTNRELAVLRVEAAARITGQKFGKEPMFGFTVFTVEPRDDARRYTLPQINHAEYWINRSKGLDHLAFDKVFAFDLDRTRHVESRGKDNPVEQRMPVP